jgi:ribonuclease VapC
MYCLRSSLDVMEINLLPDPSEAAHAAIDAFDRLGKRRHPAELNFGDCFAYACARYYAVPLLYKGNDFSKTDIEAA